MTDPVCAVVIERCGEDPVLLEAEAQGTSIDVAHEAGRKFTKNGGRYCVVELVPLFGNTLLIEDMKRLRAALSEREESRAEGKSDG